MIWALAYLPVLAGLGIWAVGASRGRTALLGGLATVATLLLALIAGGRSGRFDWSDVLTLQAALPPLAQAVAVLVPAILLPITLFAASHEEARGLPRLVGLMLVFTGGMELVVIADDLVTLLIGWEIVGACSWVLIGHRWREQPPGLSANFAFVLTRAGDLGLFLAVLTTFTVTGGAEYDALGRLDDWPLALAAFGLLVAAVSKAGQVPFAPWLFRAMDGPTSVSALLHSATMVAAGVYILARLHPYISAAPGFGTAAMALGLATAVLGGVVAVRQVHAKKLLAGSTSAQMGLMIATVGAGYPGVAVLHLVVHAATKAALFCAAGTVHRVTGSFDLREARLGRALPVSAGLTAIAALSLAAVPPLSGGWSKEEMVKAAEHAGLFWTTAAILAGGLSAAYATRFAVTAFGPGDRDEASERRGESAALLCLSGAVLAMSVLWLPWAHDAVSAWIGAELPTGTRLGLIASLTAVALGVLAGLRAARAPSAPPGQEWLGLPALYEHGVIRPFHGLAGVAARLDDGVIDLIPRGVAALGRQASGQLARLDDDHIDGLAPGAARRASQGTSRVWRGAVGIAVQAASALAALAAGVGERLSDIIPGGSGRLAGMAGADLRRLQTGLSHHYYTLLMAGFALAVGLLIIGG
ncbi:NADH-quinone oxidoreductase subunit 5 family protein [Histidinibacterium aquaticum]|uniref:NADH-quinone oxidoreductase subunit L n=1 Tax=Histidinibacterium aquaticum TaxID=2613962 RepID=A0A5J5GC85_9RHOB|nr:proton-conducting transporter membrane subunit [Histidinibacterium aquaticum]KAA9005568.1 NADH-quinone oxidoreductase subunit L [Histidinibacterium aquaticum]